MTCTINSIRGNSIRGLRTQVVVLAPVCLAIVAAFAPSFSRIAVAQDDAGLPVATIARETAVRYQDEIVPMLSASCTACHNEKVTEGGLSMDSLERIVAGGDSGPGVVAGNAAESLLFLRAAHRLDDAMPPADNSVGAVNLTPEQLGLLARWIDEGAKAGPLAMRPVEWKPLPPGVGGVLAVALSADSRVTAAARGGRVTLFDTTSGTLLPGDDSQAAAVSSLVDPTLTIGDAAVALAHADVVTSMAFSPVADLLATGSFRTIKLWERQAAEQIANIPGSAGSVLLAASSQPNGPLVVGLADGRIAVANPGVADVASTLRMIGSPGPAAVAGRLAADATTLFVAAADNSLTAYRLPDGEVVGRLLRPLGISALALASGDSQLVTAEADGVVRVWPLPLPAVTETAAAIAPTSEIAGAVFPVAAMRELPAMSGHLAVGCHDGVARIWKLDDGSLVREFPHGGAIRGLDVNADGTRLATVGGIAGVKVWNVADAALVAHTQGDFQLADSLAASDADLRVLGQDVEYAKAQVTVAEEAKKKAAEELTKMQEKLTAAEKDAKEKSDAAAAAVTAREEAEKVASTATAAVPLAEAAVEAAKGVVASATSGVEAAVASQAAFAKAAEGDEGAAEAAATLEAAVAATAAAKAAAETALAAATAQVERAKAKVDEAAKKVEEQKKAESTAADASKGAETTLTSARRDHDFATRQVANADESLPLRQSELTATEQKLAETQAARGQVDQALTASQQPFVTVAFSPDGSQMVCLDEQGVAIVCGGNDGLPRRRFMAVSGATTVAALSGDRVLVCGGPETASVWNMSDRWTLVRTIGGEQLPPALDDEPAGPPVDAVLALSFSPNGSLLASGSGRASRGGEIKLWNTTDGSLVRSIPQPHSDTVVSLAFSRDGSWLASGGTDRLAKMHELATGNTVRNFEGHTGHVLGVAWQANGRRLATAGADNVLKIWDVTSGEQQRTIGGLGREVTGVRFIGEGEEIAATSGDATVRVFNAASGGEVRRLEGAADFVQSVAIAGSTLAAGSQDGRMLIWDVANPQPRHMLEPSPAQ
jgi:WD40 repeat protein